MWMEAFLFAGRNFSHSMVSQSEIASLVKFRRADNGNGLREHHLIGAVGMQIHTRQKGCLRGMGVDPAKGDEIILVLDEEKFFLILCVTIIWSPTLLGHDHMGHCEGILGQFATKNTAGLNCSGCVGIS